MEEKKCLKCGRVCSEDQSFCGQCLAEMARYPVKPGVVVLLPQREQQRAPIRRRHTPPSPEEQLTKLKKRFAVVCVALTLALAALGILSWLTLSGFFANEEAKPLPGQNYSSETTSPSENK